MNEPWMHGVFVHRKKTQCRSGLSSGLKRPGNFYFLRAQKLSGYKV